MEEEINFRPYLEAFIHHWKWIIGAALLAATVAFIGTSLLTPTYEATALAAVMEPGEIVQFDPRIQTTGEARPLKAYPELATSDEYLGILLTETALSVDVKTIEEFRAMLTASAGADPSLLRLTANYKDPQKTAEIANAWANIFVTKTNEIYGDQGNAQLRFFESQLTDAAIGLETAEQSLIDFEARNRTTILENELDSLQQSQADQLEKQRQIVFLLQDVDSLQNQLGNMTNSSSLSATNQLAVLLLQARAFGGKMVADEATPWQIQISTEQLSGLDNREQLLFLGSLNEALAEQSEQINIRLSELEPQILILQQRKQDADIEADRLQRNMEVAKETYTALASKVEEERITSQDTSNGVRMASKAAIPGESSSPSRLVYSIIAAIIGLLIATLTIIILTWWRAQE